MSLLVVGSVALDSIFTPFGETADALGGSAVYFSVAGVAAAPGAGRRRGRQRLSGARARAARRRAGSTGPAWSSAEGESFRWKGKYSLRPPEPRDAGDAARRVRRTSSPSCRRAFRAAEFLFLGNIDPELQLGVLEPGAERPRLVVCDTMNYWIQSKRDALLELLGAGGHPHGERRRGPRAVAATGTSIAPGRWILAHGPKRVVIKQGEYGALLIEPSRTFYVPAFPLEEVFDPTGAGDAFAGGFMAYLARTGSVSEDDDPPRDGVRRGDGLATRSSSSASGASSGSRSTTWSARVRAFQDLTHVELAEPLA